MGGWVWKKAIYPNPDIWPFLTDDSSLGMSAPPRRRMPTADMADVEAVATPVHAEASQHLITILYTTWRIMNG